MNKDVSYPDVLDELCDMYQKQYKRYKKAVKYFEKDNANPKYVGEFLKVQRRLNEIVTEMKNMMRSVFDD